MAPKPPTLVAPRSRGAPRSTRASATSQHLVDDRAEGFHGVRTDQGPAIDEERGRAGDAERAALRHVGRDVSREPALGQAARERLAVEPKVPCVRDQAILREVWLLGEEPVMIGPVLPPPRGTSRGFRGLARLAV
jgi:hypothetical protein